MTGLNLAILIGNLVQDPESRYTPQGTHVATIRLAINESVKKGDERKDETTFINCVLWKGKADTVVKYLKKGDPCLVEGRISIRSYDKDGIKHWMTEVIADKLILMSNDKKEKPAETIVDLKKQRENDDDFPDIPDSIKDIPDDVPFQ